MRPLALACAVISLLAAACGSASSAGTDDGGQLVIFAASSLTSAFQELATIFEDAHPGVQVEMSFAGSSTLRLQLEQGGRADVFASANERQIALAQQSGLLAAAPLVFATSRLLVATRPGGPVRTFADLARPGVRLVVGQEEVPVGAYTKRLLDRLRESPDFGPHWVQAVEGNIASREPNVRQVLAKVELGVANAAFVYATDLAVAGESVRGIELPPGFAVEASYWVAPVADGPNPQGADDFVAFLLSDRGQAVLQRHGFGRPTP